MSYMTQECVSYMVGRITYDFLPLQLLSADTLEVIIIAFIFYKSIKKTIYFNVVLVVLMGFNLSRERHLIGRMLVEVK